ncbi:FAD-dependent oxidoreductase [Wenjunlia vitaminophila]|uniref:FAD-dependent oxidoreductase n=1 Tax=Wenjunlia vitaminophila TaxID=76728 RepID=A0A0T6LWW0_WENVI|nr:tryptophan 7-halogenase [Wenjunlia vitaminophila]KRV50548.1 FAD-dependent oxidoreductase [Wenjunlia vitaminophila]
MNLIPASRRQQFDVAILGSGIGGGMLGAALARNRVKVLLIDSGVHPRFAVGEATTPYTSVTQRVIAARYNVPELVNLTSLQDITRAIGPKFGTKTHFGFLRHEPGRPQNPRETNQFHTPEILHEAHHLYRQDVDAYVFHVAVKAGCTPLQDFPVHDVEFDGSGVTIHGGEGESYRARYVVDASGYRSPLAKKFNLRDEVCAYKHHSRSMFTHVLGITHTDDLWPDRRPEYVPPVPWYEGTVHHLFDRGWFWVIGFDNTPLSRNPLCSVGLTLDPRIYPKDTSLTPHEEFMAYASRFPDVERQYAGVKPVREWVSTDRLQYSSKQTVGDRWCLLSHAAAFIDPLYSFGLANTGDAVNYLAWRLIRACQDDDFSAERFEFIDRWQQARFHYNDEIVNAGFTAFDDFEFWKTVFRVWVWGNNAGSLRMQTALTAYKKTGDDYLFRDLEEARYLGSDWPDHEGYQHMLGVMTEQVDAVNAGKTTRKEAGDVMWDLMENTNFMAATLGFQFRNVHFMHPSRKTLLHTGRWILRHGDPDMRRLTIPNAREAIKHRLRGDKIF